MEMNECLAGAARSALEAQAPPILYGIESIYVNVGVCGVDLKVIFSCSFG